MGVFCYSHMLIGVLGIYRLLFLPAGQPPVLKLLGCPILQFFAPQGLHDSWINMKFGTADGTAVPNFTLLEGYLVISGEKKPQKLAKKCPKLQAFSPPQGRIPRPILVKFTGGMCYMRVTCLRNVLKSGAVWFINDKIVGRKL